MLFILKKYIGGLLLPLPFLLLMMGIALCLLWFSRWQKSAKALLSVSWLVLLLIRPGGVVKKWITSWCLAAAIRGTRNGHPVPI